VKRVIKPELLDHLPAEDLLAQGSRRDLQRLNAWMGSAKIMARRLSSLAPGPWQGTGRLVELGAGDGRFLSEVAKRLASAPPQGAVLVERLRLCSPETREAFSGLGWALEFATADVFDWLRQPTPHCEDWLVANLFLHHFQPDALRDLLRAIARRAQVFVALEPRRSLWGTLFSRAVGLIGCNRVTRHDAPASVRAGFTGRELSQLWPEPESWLLEERAAGPFSHLFVAQRKSFRRVSRVVGVSGGSSLAECPP
jgi:hypothetical protein